MARKRKWGAKKRQHSKGSKRPRSWHRRYWDKGTRTFNQTTEKGSE